MRRVVFLINSLAGGGAERVMTTVLAASRNQADAYELHLILLDREADVYRVPDFVTLHRLDANTSLFGAMLQLFPLLRRLAPDVVVSFLTRSNLASLALAVLLRYRAIISERAQTSGHHRGLKGRASKLLIRLLYPRAERVIAVSQGIEQDLVANFAVARQSIATIPNPIDTALIRAQATEPASITIPGPYIVGMGRLVPSKNFALLIRAFAASDYRGHLLILGQGPERPNLEALATGLGIAERVIFAGFRANPFPLIQAADAFLLSSNAEGFPNGLLEAMTLGRPVIATNCPTGPAEILDAGTSSTAGVHLARYGIIVPVDTVAPMQQAISMLNDADLRADLSARARAGAARYRLDNIVAAYWRIIARDQPAST